MPACWRGAPRQGGDPPPQMSPAAARSVAPFSRDFFRGVVFGAEVQVRALPVQFAATLPGEPHPLLVDAPGVRG